MGKKKAETNEPPAADKAATEKKEEDKEKKEEGKEKPEEEEDPPIIKELKKLDDDYLAIEREYEKKVFELQKEFSAKQEPLLQKRSEILLKGIEGQPPTEEGDLNGQASCGTPGLKDFWLTALQNFAGTQDFIEEWDIPVLKFLTDIKKDFLDADDDKKGFKLTFLFAENPFFENREIVKEYLTREESPYTGEIAIIETKCTEIEWKEGKNVTVEVVKKKVKGGGAKKKGKAKGKEESRPSFFREIFRSLKEGMELPEGMADSLNIDDEDDIDDPDELVNVLLDNEHEIGTAVRDQLIPFAVRWYTGEACEDDDDDDDDDEDEEEESDDEDDEDDDDDDDDEPPKKAKGAQKKGAGAKGKGKGKDGEKEECKQQ